MKNNFYGNIKQNCINDDVSRYVEEISIKGFTVIPNLFSAKELVKWRGRIDDVYEKQENDFGRASLIEIQELDMCRAPILYDFEFIKIATHEVVLGIVKKILGEFFVLHLQNAIINRPNSEHHQSSWHRDLPYQNYTISQPLAISVLWAIDEFSDKTGGTNLVPFSHKTESLPSDSYIANNYITANVPAGSVVVFDSMLLHKAGNNISEIIRRAVNHVYVSPMLKQQYDFSRALDHISNNLTSFEKQLLGFTSQAPLDDKAWRENRSKRLFAKD